MIVYYQYFCQQIYYHTFIDYIDNIFKESLLSRPLKKKKKYFLDSKNILMKTNLELIKP